MAQAAEGHHHGELGYARAQLLHYTFFSQRGFRTQCATYYDEEPPLKKSREFLKAASETPNCTGWTYTPWGHSRDQLENFVDLANSFRPPTVVP